MSACEMGALCCKSSPCAYWAVDGNAEELAALRAEVEQERELNAMLLVTMQRIADLNFNCAPHQHGMAMQSAAEAAIITVAAARAALAKEPSNEG